MFALPPNVGTTLDLADAYRRYQFEQLDLVNAGKFLSRLRERGISCGRSDLRRMHREGSLRALGFVRAPSASIGLREMMFPDDRVVDPWSDDDVDGSFEAYFSPWQLLYGPDAYRGNRWNVSLHLLSEGLGVAPNVADAAAAELGRWRTLDAAWRPVLGLLVRVQNAYAPRITGRHHPRWSDDVHDWVWPWQDERVAFDPVDALAEINVDVESVVAAYEWLSFRGQNLDQFPGSYLALRSSRVARERLRRDARRAWDYYDAAEVLRALLAEIEGDVRPEPDVVGHDPAWRAAQLGHEPRLHVSFSDVRHNLESLKLWPIRVHVLVEGRSEEDMLREIWLATSGTHSPSGIVISVLGGDARISVSAADLLAAGSAAEHRVVVVDRSGPAERQLRALKAAGELDDVRVVYSDPDLEEANFTPEEISRAIRELAADAGVDINVSLDDLARRRREGEALASAALSIAAEQHVRIRKPDLAKHLARIVIADAEAAGWDEVAARRPIAHVAVSMLRAR